MVYAQRVCCNFGGMSALVNRTLAFQDGANCSAVQEVYFALFGQSICVSFGGLVAGVWEQRASKEYHVQFPAGPISIRFRKLFSGFLEMRSSAGSSQDARRNILLL
jgi:hypothetical protein